MKLEVFLFLEYIEFFKGFFSLFCRIFWNVKYDLRLEIEIFGFFRKLGG